MASNQPNLLCRYRYDPLDRLIDQSQVDMPTQQRFYCKSRLANEIHGAMQHSIFQHGDLLLAQQQRQGDQVSAALLVTDLQRSVLRSLEKNHQQQSIAYSPYGHHHPGNGLLRLLGFNGERPDPVTGYYVLGNGYRAFNPVLMRFNSPDSLSPFGKGGLNSYAYCLGDPVNRHDESGHISWLRGLSEGLKKINKVTNKLFVSKPKTTTLYKTISRNPLTPDEALGGFERAINNRRKIVARPKQITRTNDLDAIPYEKQRSYKELKSENYYGSGEISFIFNENKELFIASTGHETLSLIAGSPRLISAGEITRTGWNSFTLSNASGHFRPAYESLNPVKKHLENLGASVETIRMNWK